VDGYEEQNGAYYWHLRGQFDCTEHPPSGPSDSVLIPIGFVSANRHLRRATPRSDWLVVRISYLMEVDPVC
jgi:hypothetical protein